LEKYSRIKVRYGDVVAWVLIPKGSGPFPAVLAAHPTYNGGKDSVVGLSEKPGMHYGKELAELGFVVLAPDSITAGERVLPGAKPYVTDPFDKQYPDWSAMGKMLADHKLGIDYLVSLPQVDKTRIAAIGHSLGGYNSFFLAAFDDRVKAAVSSCGFTMLAGTSRPFAWSRDSWFVHFPKLQPYLRGGIIPFDMHEVVSLIAPRAFFNFSARGDSIFPNPEAIEAGGRAVREVYEMLGAQDQYRFLMGEGPHDFPDAVRRNAYAWLREKLNAR
jgi:dienelactone hydrolase